MNDADLQWRDAPAAWGAESGEVRVRFVGRRSAASREEALAEIADAPPPRLAWAQQVHGRAVLAARPGPCGAGDALHTEERGLALAIATADCVPVLLAAEAGIAAVHAGWRGLVAGVLSAALERLAGEPAAVRAWIGPAIGPCCYEVGDEVAEAVAGAGRGDAVRRREGRPRPHLDLHLATRLELAAAGVRQVHALALCTRCTPTLWSYRRDGSAAGRNLAFIWQR